MADEPIDPTISTSVAGPLGIKHLPRLWLKILLHACGRLPEGYRHGNGGIDGYLLETLGIDAPAFIAFIEGEKPDYLRLEAWVRDHATNLDPETIHKLNLRISGQKMPPELAAERRARFNVADPEFAFAIPLNDLDDWASVHRRVTADKEATAVGG